MDLRSQQQAFMDYLLGKGDSLSAHIVEQGSVPTHIRNVL